MTNKISFPETLQSSWRCSVCRRKIASRDQPIVTQESTDSLLDVPILEALQRRHSDARLGPTGSQIGALGSGLAPPRSPEIRRHSDVSPASLKELEKVSEKNLIRANRAFRQKRTHFKLMLFATQCAHFALYPVNIIVN